MRMGCDGMAAKRLVAGIVCALRCHLLRSCLLQELQERIDFSPTQAKMIYDGDCLR